MRKRQVHLDFHTSGLLTVGDKFSKEQFAKALTLGNVDSITVFSKCHHGWSYHPTKANEMHPGLNFDLLGAQLEVCKELGVNAPVYISAGLDEKGYDKHPEWRWKPSLSEEEIKKYDSEAHFHLLCFNTEYLDVLCSQIEEVMEMYNPCGIFLDIISPKVCYCDNCLADMKALGLDVDSAEDRENFSHIVFDKYVKATNAAVRKHSETATIFHNSGHIFKGNHKFINYNTHLELESLPTGGWGYDHFPLSAAYVRTLGDKEYLGMTGKFHQSWGEFGGFKHPNALKYEIALSLANGACCSVGDQMHPEGFLDEATYALIGIAYAEAEKVEEQLQIKAQSIETQITNLSGGNMQKVVLGKWLCKGLKVLILDEPTRGIDVGSKAQIYEIMSNLAEQGVAIIMISSELPELVAMCDRMYVLAEGQMTAELVGDEINETNMMRAAIATLHK